MRIPKLILIATFTVVGSGTARAQAKPVPEWVVTQWERLIGTWIADNSAYESADAEMDAYGLEWSWGLGRKTLVGRLFGIRDGKDIGTFWEFREFWHPGEGQLLTTQFGSDGTYGVGPHVYDADGTSEMLQTFYDPTTGRISRVGHRAELKGDEHTTRSFDVDDDGVWKERRTYVWRRQ